MLRLVNAELSEGKTQRFVAPAIFGERSTLFPIMERWRNEAHDEDILLAALAMLVAGNALAQLSIDRDVETDSRRDRKRLGPHTPPEPGPPPGTDFEIALTAPILFTDNAVGTAATPRDRGGAPMCISIQTSC